MQRIRSSWLKMLLLLALFDTDAKVRLFIKVTDAGEVRKSKKRQKVMDGRFCFFAFFGLGLVLMYLDVLMYLSKLVCYMYRYE